MNERGEGGGEGIGVLCCLAVIAVIIWLAKVVILWLVEQTVTWVIPILIPTALVYLLVVYYKQIWKAHLVLGRWIVQLVRDLPVRIFWSGSGSQRIVRLAVVFWIIFWPGLLAYILVRGGSWLWTQMIVGTSSLMLFRFIFGLPLFIHDEPAVWGLLPALTSAGSILYGYYFYYFKGPLREPRLVRFTQELWIMLASLEMSLAALVTRTKLRFLEQPSWRKGS